MNALAQVLDFGVASRIAFSILFVLLILLFLYTFWYRLQIMFKTKGQKMRWDQPLRRVGLALKFAFGQYRMPQELAPGLLHMAIFYGFLTVSLRTIMLTIVLITGDSQFHLWILGPDNIVGQMYTLGKDIMTVVVATAAVVLIWRRLVTRPKRFEGAHNYEASAILLWIFLLMLSDFLVEASQLALEAHLGEAGGHWFMPFASLASGAFIGASQSTLALLWKTNVWIHITLVWLFLNYLPLGKHFHVITAIPNVFFQRLEPYGALATVHNIEEEFEKEEPSVGVKDLEDVSWKEIFDVYTCTECGRCVPQCPAFDTGKPLSLRDVNMSIKAHLYDKGPYITGRKKNPDGSEPVYEGQQLTGGAISTETLWACNLCRDCEERCPVFIEQIPRIVQMRQYLVMMEGDMPNELNNLFKGYERNSNPWNIGFDKRGDWITEDVNIPVMAELSAKEQEEIEYLFYVGCMGSYDDRSIKITKALIDILNAAGVKAAVLGPEESCCGETVRRLGNEFLGQVMVQQLVETINQYPIKNIVASCPHCFNTLKNEYPEFGGNWNVVHAQQLVAELIEGKRIDLKYPVNASISYHDSCFLGRYNNVYEAPRDIIGAIEGLQLKEPELHKSQGYCCGAGGGRMWLEEGKEKVNYHRFKQLDELGCDIIGASCPYCNTMLTDGSKGVDRDEDVKVKDVLELVVEAMNGPKKKGAPQEEPAPEG